MLCSWAQVAAIVNNSTLLKPVYFYVLQGAASLRFAHV